MRNGHFGGKGGRISKFQISAGETLEKITGTNVRFDGELCIGQITVTTSTGRAIGPFGYNGNPKSPDRVISNFVFNRRHGQRISAAAGEPGRRFVKEIYFQ